MDMTTVRVRRARADTLSEHGVEKDGRELVEVTAHGQPVGLVDAQLGDVVWNDDAFDDSLAKELVKLVKAALPLMQQARNVFAGAEA